MAEEASQIIKDKQYFKFCLYGFLKNLRFFEPFLIIFFLQKGLSYLEIGSLYAVREIAINLFEIPSGIIADALGRRLTLATTFLIYILSFLLFYIGQDFILFSGAMVLYALGDAGRSGINKALIVGYLTKTGQSGIRVDYYGHTRSWSQFGSAISSLAAGVLVFYNENLNTIFLFSIVPYVLDFFNVMSYPKFLDDNTNTQTKARNNLSETLSLFVKSMRNPRLLQALLNAAIYGGYYKSLKDFIQPFLKASLLAFPILLMLTDHEKLSLVLGITYFLIFMASAIASRNAETIKLLIGSRKRLLNSSLVVGAILGGISGALMNSWNLPLLIISLFILLLLLENLRKPSAVAEITLIGEATVHTSVLSVLSQLTSLFTALLAIIIGLLADQYSLGIGIVAASLIVLTIYPFVRLKETET